MGWWGHKPTHFKNGKVDRKAELIAQAEKWENFTLLKGSLIGTTWYAAVRDDRTGEVFGMVTLTSIDDGYFMVKEMDETVGPFYYQCPMNILKLLTPTDNEQANEWRKNCWQYHEEQKDPYLFKNLPEGAKVKWTVASSNWLGDLEKGQVHTLEKIKYHKRYYWQLENRSIIDPKHISRKEYEPLIA